MLDGLILGAYTVEPALDVLAAREGEWYELLAGIDGAAGVEVPYRGGLHRDGAAKLAERLPSGWRVVATMLPATMITMRGAREYGLASPDADGRARAVRDLAAVRDDIQRLNDATGTATVLGVHLHSAPRGVADAAAFTASLTELAGRDWDGAALIVEHCDAARPDGQVAKGFLSLAAETEIARSVGVTQAINWGRSAIEGRSAETAAQHIAELAAAGTLGGVMFSGTSATGGALAPAWEDLHNPLDTVDPTSLLTEYEVDRSVAAWAGLLPPFVGVKVIDPSRATELDDRLEPLRVTAAAVRRALAG